MQHDSLLHQFTHVDVAVSMAELLCFVIIELLSSICLFILIDFVVALLMTLTVSGLFLHRVVFLCGHSRLFLIFLITRE